MEESGYQVIFKYQFSLLSVVSQVKSKFIVSNSRIKNTAKLHNTKLCSRIHVTKLYTIKFRTKYTKKQRKQHY